MRKKREKVLVLFSSGIDSTVVATKLQADGYDVELMYVKYGGRTEKKELSAARKIADYLDVRLYEVPANNYKWLATGSSLLSKEDKIKKGSNSNRNAPEWLPARNLYLLSVATVLAETHKIHTIAIGVGMVDNEAGAYPDSTEEFLRKFGYVLEVATKFPIKIINVLQGLDKEGTLAMGILYNAPLHLTWSCYRTGKYHCGKCNPCYARKQAFKKLKLKDNYIKYENVSSNRNEQYGKSGFTKKRP